MAQISKHKATVGRNLWLWSNQPSNAEDPKQPFDAKVILTYPDGRVKLQYTNHWGTTSTLYTPVPIHDPQDTDAHGAGPDWYATWMPYQKQQMDKQTVNE